MKRIKIELGKIEAQELYAVGIVLMDDNAAMDKLMEAGIDVDKIYRTLEKIGREAFKEENA